MPDHRPTSPKKVSDPLTGLPNRLLFIDRVGRLIKHTKRRKDQLLRFYSWTLTVQDDQRQHGPPDWGSTSAWSSQSVGEVFAVNGYVARLGETFTVARLGGDEFTVLLDDIKDLAMPSAPRTV